MTENTFHPTLLTEKSSLQEIYDLRVDVWEKSIKSEFVNRQLFPNGWTDDFDEKGKIFVIKDDEKIIASARLNSVLDLCSFPFYNEIKHLNLPKSSPFGYYSRLVISPLFQGKGLSIKLDKIIIDTARELELKWLIGLASERTEYMIKKLGFYKYGIAQVRYNTQSNFHPINVIIKQI